MKKIITVLLSCIMLVSLTGCAMFESKINDIKGNLVEMVIPLILLITMEKEL